MELYMCPVLLHLLSSLVLYVHGELICLPKIPVATAELAVVESIEKFFLVFFPEKHKVTAFFFISENTYFISGSGNVRGFSAGG